MAFFNRRCQVVLTHALSIRCPQVYPGVSVAVFGIFSCTRVSSGIAYLNEDVNIVCYTRSHRAYMGAGVGWVFLYTLGIPAFFIVLLVRHKVPQLARELAENAWLRELATTATREGLPLSVGGENLANLTTDTITERHLDALYAYFVRGLASDAASAIMEGDQPPLFLRDNEVSNKKIAVPYDRRGHVLAVVLRFARNSGAIAIPAMRWSEEEEQEEAPEKVKESSTGCKRIITKLWPAEDNESGEVMIKAQKLRPRQVSKAQTSQAQAALRETALCNVGFLFEAYRPECWYWEIVELGRKLALTSILALIAPGSAGQVVVGLLLALFMLLINTQFQPYADKSMNLVNQITQLNLALFLLAALLLKVNLDDQAQASFFSGIVGALSIFPIALPVLLKLYTLVFASEEGESVVEESGGEKEDWGMAEFFK